MFLTEEAVRLTLNGVAVGVACDGCPPLPALAVDKIVEHARRQQAVFTYRGEPMVAVSVDLTIEGWTVDRILRERMWSRSRYATTDVGQLRRAGYELVATSTAPHYSVILPEVSDAAAAEFLSHFGPTLDNEFRQRRR